MKAFKILLLLLLLAVIVKAQFRSVESVQDGGKPNVFSKLYDLDGHPFAKRWNETKEPMIIVDRIKLKGLYTVVKLNSRFTPNRHNIAPTNINNTRIYVTQILEDTSVTVRYYGCFLYPSGDSLMIKSSGGAADTGYVSIMLVTR